MTFDKCVLNGSHTSGQRTLPFTTKQRTPCCTKRCQTAWHGMPPHSTVMGPCRGPRSWKLWPAGNGMANSYPRVLESPLAASRSIWPWKDQIHTYGNIESAAGRMGGSQAYQEYL